MDKRVHTYFNVALVHKLTGGHVFCLLALDNGQAGQMDKARGG